MYTNYSVEENEIILEIINLIGEEIPPEEALATYYEIMEKGSSLY